MPYRSERQRRFFHAAERRGEIPSSVVREWDKASQGASLPEVVVSKNKRTHGWYGTTSGGYGEFSPARETPRHSAGSFYEENPAPRPGPMAQGVFHSDSTRQAMSPVRQRNFVEEAWGSNNEQHINRTYNPGRGGDLKPGRSPRLPVPQRQSVLSGGPSTGPEPPKVTVSVKDQGGVKRDLTAAELRPTVGSRSRGRSGGGTGGRPRAATTPARPAQATASTTGDTLEPSRGPARSGYRGASDSAVDRINGADYTRYEGRPRTGEVSSPNQGSANNNTPTSGTQDSRPSRWSNVAMNVGLGVVAGGVTYAVTRNANLSVRAGARFAAPGLASEGLGAIGEAVGGAIGGERGRSIGGTLGEIGGFGLGLGYGMRGTASSARNLRQRITGSPSIINPDAMTGILSVGGRRGVERAGVAAVNEARSLRRPIRSSSAVVAEAPAQAPAPAPSGPTPEQIQAAQNAAQATVTGNPSPVSVPPAIRSTPRSTQIAGTHHSSASLPTPEEQARIWPSTTPTQVQAPPPPPEPAPVRARTTRAPRTVTPVQEPTPEPTPPRGGRNARQKAGMGFSGPTGLTHGMAGKTEVGMIHSPYGPAPITATNHGHGMSNMRW